MKYLKFIFIIFIFIFFMYLIPIYNIDLFDNNNIDLYVITLGKEERIANIKNQQKK